MLFGLLGNLQGQGESENLIMNKTVFQLEMLHQAVEHLVMGKWLYS